MVTGVGEAMVTPEFARVMARYNSWQNRSLMEAADGLSDEVRWQDFGFNLVYMVNHQTHHRGQVHALLTRCGAAPEATDLQMLDR